MGRPHPREGEAVGSIVSTSLDCGSSRVVWVPVSSPQHLATGLRGVNVGGRGREGRKPGSQVSKGDHGHFWEEPLPRRGEDRHLPLDKAVVFAKDQPS